MHVSDGFAAQTAKHTDVVAAAPSRLVPLQVQQCMLLCDTCDGWLRFKVQSLQMW
jgi:hypothetical protein